jgi:hypothetical protein
MPNPESAASSLEDAVDLLCSFDTLLGKQFKSLADAIDAAQVRQAELDAGQAEGSLACDFELLMLEALLERGMQALNVLMWRQ